MSRQCIIGELNLYFRRLQGYLTFDLLRYVTIFDILLTVILVAFGGFVLPGGRVFIDVRYCFSFHPSSSPYSMSSLILHKSGGCEMPSDLKLAQRRMENQRCFRWVPAHGKAQLHPNLGLEKGNVCSCKIWCYEYFPFSSKAFWHSLSWCSEVVTFNW